MLSFQGTLTPHLHSIICFIASYSTPWYNYLPQNSHDIQNNKALSEQWDEWVSHFLSELSDRGKQEHYPVDWRGIVRNIPFLLIKLAYVFNSPSSTSTNSPKYTQVPWASRAGLGCFSSPFYTAIGCKQPAYANKPQGAWWAGVGALGKAWRFSLPP